MNNLKENILKKIESGGVRRKSRWYFLGKKYIFLTLFLLSIIFGAISFAILLKNIFNDFGVWYHLKFQENLFLSNIIWIWVFTILLFIFSSLIYFKKTKKGFKYTNLAIISFSILSSIILGSIFYEIKIGHYFERYLEHHNHKYFEIKKEKMKYLKKYLDENEIDYKEFFENHKILKRKREYDMIDKNRVDRIKSILENNDIKNKEDVLILLNRIKEKKIELDQKRILLLIEEYKKE